MAIDVHQHPLFFASVCDTPEKLATRLDKQAYYKMGVQNAARVIEQNRINGVEKSVLLPHDFSVEHDDRITNDEMQRLVREGNGAFYGFASVNPHREDAVEELERAFDVLGLSGLKLHPAKQRIQPMDPQMLKLYEVCEKRNKPIIFHAGLSWQPDTLSEYARPVKFEPIAHEFPKLRFSLAHMGFPWVTETAALLAKYPTIYADTAALYFDSTDEFFGHVLGSEMEITWLDRGIRHQVMFGTNSPRWGAKRAIPAIQRLSLRPDTIDCILTRNALEFLGEEEAKWLD